MLLKNQKLPSTISFFGRSAERNHLNTLEAVVVDNMGCCAGARQNSVVAVEGHLVPLLVR